MVQSFREFVLAEQIASYSGKGIVSRVTGSISDWWNNRKAAKHRKKAARAARDAGEAKGWGHEHAASRLERKATHHNQQAARVAQKKPTAPANKKPQAHPGWDKLRQMGKDAMSAPPTQVVHPAPKPKKPSQIKPAAPRKPQKVVKLHPKKPKTQRSGAATPVTHSGGISGHKVTHLQFPRRR